MPDRWAAQRATDAFFQYGDPLFHVYSRQQLHDFAREDLQVPLPDPEGAISASRALGIASVSAVAAVGYQYVSNMPDAIGDIPSFIAS